MIPMGISVYSREFPYLCHEVDESWSCDNGTPFFLPFELLQSFSKNSSLPDRTVSNVNAAENGA